MIFNSHLVTQFFVVNEVKENLTELAKGVAVVNGDSITIQGVSDPATITGISADTVQYANITTAGKMDRKLNAIKLSLDPEVNDGNPVVSQDYVVRLDFKRGFGFSDEDSYIKHSAVRATSAMANSENGKKLFYNKLAISIFKNLKKMYTLAIEIKATANGNAATGVQYNADGTEKCLVSGSTPLDFTDGIYFVEKDLSDKYEPGLTHVAPIDFAIVPTTIILDGVLTTWGKTESVDSNATVSNGTKVAEMEWYFMGDRADQERGVFGPLRSITTKLMVDSSKKYNMLDIQYCWQGEQVYNTGKSPKHLIVVSEHVDKLETIVDNLGIKEIAKEDGEDID